MKISTQLEELLKSKMPNVIPIFGNLPDFHNNIGYLDIASEQHDQISYITTERQDRFTDFFDVSQRKKFAYRAKPGKVFKTIFGDSINNTELEKLSTSLKINSIKIDENNFSILYGDDLLWGYNYRNYYSQDGSLGDSCMKNCPKFIKFYAINDIGLVVKLVNNKVAARALLWKTYINEEEVLIMDRIYSIDANSENEMLKYAVSKNFLTKSSMNSYSGTKFKSTNGEVTSVFSIDLKYADCEYYPYADTFIYLDINSKTLSNSLDYFPKKKVRVMQSTDGTTYEDHRKFSKFYKAYIKENEVYIKSLNDYVPLDKAVKILGDYYCVDDTSKITIDSITNEYILLSNAVFSDLAKGFIDKDTAIFIIGVGYIHKSSELFRVLTLCKTKKILVEMPNRKTKLIPISDTVYSTSLNKYLYAKLSHTIHYIKCEKLGSEQYEDLKIETDYAYTSDLIKLGITEATPEIYIYSI